MLKTLELEISWDSPAEYAVKENKLIKLASCADGFNMAEECRLYAINERTCVALIPTASSTQDKLVYSACLPQIKSKYSLERVITVCSWEEFEAELEQRPLDPKECMSKQELELLQIKQSEEEEMRERVKQHTEGKVTEAAISGGFHRIEPQWTASAESAVSGFMSFPPQISTLGKILVLSLDVSKNPVVVDVVVQKSIPVGSQLPSTDTQIFLYCFALDSECTSFSYGVVTNFFGKVPPATKFLYASVLPSITRRLGLKLDFNITLDNETISHGDIMAMVEQARTEKRTSFPRAAVAKRILPKRTAKSTFMSLNALI